MPSSRAYLRLIFAPLVLGVLLTVLAGLDARQASGATLGSRTTERQAPASAGKAKKAKTKTKYKGKAEGNKRSRAKKPLKSDSSRTPASRKSKGPSASTTSDSNAIAEAPVSPAPRSPSAPAGSPAREGLVTADTSPVAPVTTSDPSLPIPTGTAPPDAGGNASAAAGNVLFNTNYARGLRSWQSVQEPAEAQRITVVTAPGNATDPVRPSGSVMRVELRSGDMTNTSGYLAPRAEVFGRTATPMSQPADRWPDPPGSVRWYSFAVFVPYEFAFATDAKWTTITQWKGLRGGPPPVSIEIKRGNLRVGGARSNSGLVPSSDLGPIAKGRWTRLVIGLRLSTDSAQGWIEVYRDGTLRVPHTPLATMDTINSSPDPIYLKQGIYRDDKWTTTQVLYFGPTKVASAMDAVT